MLKLIAVLPLCVAASIFSSCGGKDSDAPVAPSAKSGASAANPRALPQGKGQNQDRIQGQNDADAEKDFIQPSFKPVFSTKKKSQNRPEVVDGKISFSEVTRLWFEKHLNRFNSTRRKSSKIGLKDAAEGFEQLIRDLPAENPHELKVEYEKRISMINGLKKGKAGKPQPILYNKEATTIFDVLVYARIQSYSGTVLNQIITRQSEGARKFASNHHVVIFEPNHVLPGYVVQERGGRWHLYGIETTAVGKARIDYGFTTELYRPIRVIDADDFAQLDLFGAELDGLQNVSDLMLYRTQELYDIPLTHTESLVRQYMKNDGQKEPLKGLRAIPMLSFGKGNIRPSDQQRDKITDFEALPLNPAAKLNDSAPVDSDEEVWTGMNPFKSPPLDDPETWGFTVNFSGSGISFDGKSLIEQTPDFAAGPKMDHLVPKEKPEAKKSALFLFEDNKRSKSACKLELYMDPRDSSVVSISGKLKVVKAKSFAIDKSAIKSNISHPADHGISIHLVDLDSGIPYGTIQLCTKTQGGTAPYCQSGYEVSLQRSPNDGSAHCEIRAFTAEK